MFVASAIGKKPEFKMTESQNRNEAFVTTLCWFQGIYYFLTGLWPILDIRSFKRITGEKTDNLPTGLDADHWLVMAVSLLITAIAITLLVAAWRRTLAIEIAVLAISGAIGLTIIDVVYTARGVILPIYLLDAALEIPLIFAWSIAVLFNRQRPSAWRGGLRAIEKGSHSGARAQYCR
jgi:hypothetical protein